MQNIKSFQEYNTLVWDPKRRPVDPRLMPNEENIQLYTNSVKEEVEKILKKVYQLGTIDITKIQNVIWNSHKNDWKDIFDDCLVNWDTPENCAQKCVNYMKNLFNLT